MNENLGYNITRSLICFKSKQFCIKKGVSLVFGSAIRGKSRTRIEYFGIDSQRSTPVVMWTWALVDPYSLWFRPKPTSQTTMFDRFSRPNSQTGRRQHHVLESKCGKWDRDLIAWCDPTPAPSSAPNGIDWGSKERGKIYWGSDTVRKPS